MADKTYFDANDLKNFGKITEFQEPMGKKFFEYYNEVMKAGTLTTREKALIALAVAHAEQCPYCIDAYTTTCLENGCDEEQMMEAVHVAATMKAGITLVYSTQMMRHTKNLTM
ncbi:MAG: arsenosugar biosynthesis-associated peroxidase-like protein [Saprospiraceae bacterium]|nr:arsenosugar biosynthesis-associated peroxidase-like protein [Saprospiraceae bacterium]MBP7679717.1 arsenosugar biosynthesis-associated peroxidase-like protein [Saprospiraceae bacterium]